MPINSTPKLILLEFNELCPLLLTQWMEDGSLPNFKSFFDQSQSYITVADAAPPALEPWIQWYSIHTGLSYDQHQVFRLTDGPQAGHPDIWGVLRDAGLNTFNCSSMNAKNFAGEGSVFLPDPWLTTERPHPEELNIFYQFVSNQVQGYTNKDNVEHLHVYIKFLYFMMRHGMRVKTINLILYNLFKEIFLDKKLSWKRPIIHDQLQADIFLHYWKKYTPDFSTFFLNSTAHFQHTYWRYMDPEIFSDKPNSKDVAQYRDAILFGYRNMDRLLEDFFALENNHGVMLVLATALSQQPFLKYESIGGQRFYRPRNVEALFAQFAIYPQKIQPTMTHQFMARFDSKEDAQTAFEFLSGIFCENENVFDYDRRSDTEIYFGCQLRKQISENATIDFGLNNRQPLPFYDIFYMIDQTKSGRHHPDGILWIKTGEAEVCAKKVSILDIFPTIISITKVDYQASQGHPFRGRSLHFSSKDRRSESMSLLSRH